MKSFTGLKAILMTPAALAAGGACVAGCLMMSSVDAADKTALVRKVAADFAGRTAPVWHYAVPPMSELQRLPDAYPSDGVPNGTVRIVAAKDEYEPGSFLVWARSDLGKVELELGEFKQVENGKVEKEGGGGQRTTDVVFPKANLDLKFVKVWYQNRNGWFSYFGDTGFKLCPELLLNDEDLIRVDVKKEANYAKLVDKDGRKSEIWINPPRQFDKRVIERGWDTAPAFHCMRADFRDAATLQPVALPKHEFRQFFLTAHVTPDTPAGLYRGEIRIRGQRSKVKGQTEDGKSPLSTSTSTSTLYSIPVEIRVLDFTLPEPKCYAEPEKDFLVSSYSYISLQHISELNGFDTALAKRQMLAVLKNQVEHNQTMHMVRGGFDNEAFETVEVMRKAGMRTDALMGGVAGPGGGTPEEMRAHAQMVADELDRRYGHHNAYIGYGDEPGADWLAQKRPMFEATQSAGLKFFIAGETVFSKAGYIYDWHNAARDAVDPTLPNLWAKMKNASHSAWYANQHVGCENPALTRRQNGLGAWLTGYTALCNYAHHFGPYNDDSTTYKPMVFAYGSYDGVIDTLAWEGFREGVDDIRYATLLSDLARKAQKSKDVKLRYLGGLAMQYLAMTDPKACDQDSVRGEMIRFISELKDRVAPYDVPRETKLTPEEIAAAKAAAKRAEDGLRAAVAKELAKLAAARNANESNRVHCAVAETYRRRGRQDEGGAYLEKQGLLHEAIRYYNAFPEKQQALRERIYLENKGGANGRGEALMEMYDEHPELVEREYDASNWPPWIKMTDTNGVRRTIQGIMAENEWSLGGVRPVFVSRERPRAFAAVYRHVIGLAKKWDVPVTAGFARNATWAYTLLHDPKSAVEAARLGLRDEKAKGADRYRLGLVIALANVRGRAENFRDAAKKYDATVKDVKNEDRVAALCAYGSILLTANGMDGRSGEEAVRGLNEFRKSLYRSEPKKRYAVQFSDTPVTGMSDWAKIAAEEQAYDRRYGGNLDFLVTDVTSGNRAAGTSKEKLADPTMKVVADVNGVHFLVTQADPKAQEVALGLAGNCSFEGYIAPGANTPYACFMYEPANGRVVVFNTTYPTHGQRRLEQDDPNRKFRFTTEYGDGVVRHWLFFSWENWMQRVPREGTVWDFENMCWHRSGNSCWNGTESIHGRSTWGELEFHLTERQRAKILKPLLAAALRVYNAEKRCEAGRDGALAHWQDAAMGDPAFYAAKVKPLRDELDKYAQLVKTDMTDDTVAWLAENALGRWQDILFEIERRRAAWLLERNAKFGCARQP